MNAAAVPREMQGEDAPGTLFALIMVVATVYLFSAVGFGSTPDSTFFFLRADKAMQLKPAISQAAQYIYCILVKFFRVGSRHDPQ